MDFKDWYQNIVPGVVGSPHHKDPHLQVHAVLQCRPCGNSVDVETQPRKIRQDGQPNEYIHSALIQIAQSRPCEDCGLVSILPKQDKEHLQEQMERVISREWLDEQLLLEPSSIRLVLIAKPQEKVLLGK